MRVPPEQVVVLQFLLVCHLEHVVVELSEHVEIGKSNMVPHEERSGFKVLLQMLTKPALTLRSSLPYLRWALTPQISSPAAPSPSMNDRHCGMSSRSRLHIWKISTSTPPSAVTNEGTGSCSFPLLTAAMAA